MTARNINQDSEELKSVESEMGVTAKVVYTLARTHDTGVESTRATRQIKFVTAKQYQLGEIVCNSLPLCTCSRPEFISHEIGNMCYV